MTDIFLAACAMTALVVGAYLFGAFWGCKEANEQRDREDNRRPQPVCGPCKRTLNKSHNPICWTQHVTGEHHDDRKCCEQMEAEEQYFSAGGLPSDIGDRDPGWYWRRGAKLWRHKWDVLDFKSRTAPTTERDADE